MSQVSKLIFLLLSFCAFTVPLQAETDDDCGMDLPPVPQTLAVIVGKVARSGDGEKQNRFKVQVVEKVLLASPMAKPDPRFWTPGSEFRAIGLESTEVGERVLIAVRRSWNSEPNIQTASIAKATIVPGTTSPRIRHEDGAPWRQWLDAQRRLADLRKADIAEADRETAKLAIYAENGDIIDANASFFAALAASDMTPVERDRRTEAYCLEHCPLEAMEARGRLMKGEAASPYDILVYKAAFSDQHALMKDAAKALWWQAHDLAPREIAPMIALLGDAIAHQQPDFAQDFAQEILKVDPSNLPAKHALFALSGYTKPGDMPLAGLKADALDLVGLDLHGADMSSMWIDKLHARDADLEGSNLDGLDSNEARGNPIGPIPKRPRNVVFGSDTRAADPNDMSGVRVDLTGAKLSGASFRKAALWALRLEGTSLRGGDFTGAELGGATAQPVQRTPDFDVWAENPHPDIVDVVFDATRFRDALFLQARLKHVTFAHVDLTGAVFQGGSLEDVDLTTANLAKTTFLHTTYDCATRLPSGFDAAAAGLFPTTTSCRAPISLKGRTITTNMSALDLAGADLSGIRCEKRCNFTRSNLTKADLSGADFQDRADNVFDDATLDDADLSRATVGHQAYVPPGKCEMGIKSPTLILLQAKSLKGTKLAGWTISLADIAREARSSGEQPIKDAPSPISNAAMKLAAADLGGALLACGLPIRESSTDDARAVASDIRTLLDKLRKRPGVIVETNCR